MTEEMQERYVDSPASLGERCVAWSLARVGLKESPAGSDNGPDIERWRAQCVRGYGDQAKPLGLGPVSWCSIFACAAMQACLEEGERAPHGFRAGVVELVDDTRTDHGFSGQWKDLDLVCRGRWFPHIGDLAIYTRAQQGKPTTSWWRHVNRVVAFDSTGTFWAVGGNEGGGEVLRSVHTIHEPRLLGFIAYP
jgi:hypothetical protein